MSLRTIPPPPGVYEYVTDEATGRRRLSINAQNCLHCKVGWELPHLDGIRICLDLCSDLTALQGILDCVYASGCVGLHLQL